MITTLAPISIVVPMRNEAKTIPLLLTALLKQTKPPAELIIVDNNSTDGCARIARRFSRLFQKKGCTFTVTTENRPGVAVTRNTGVLSATQPTLGFLDADCIPSSDWTVNAVQALHAEHSMTAQHQNPIVSSTGQIIMFDAPLLVRKVTEYGWYRWYFSVMKVLCGFHFLPTGNCIINRQIFMRCGGFDQSLRSINDLEDVELASRIAQYGHVVYRHNLKVYSSFRRYETLSKAITASLSRLARLIDHTRKYRLAQKKN